MLERRRGLTLGCIRAAVCIVTQSLRRAALPDEEALSLPGEFDPSLDTPDEVRAQAERTIAGALADSPFPHSRIPPPPSASPLHRLPRHPPRLMRARPPAPPVTAWHVAYERAQFAPIPPTLQHTHCLSPPPLPSCASGLHEDPTQLTRWRYEAHAVHGRGLAAHYRAVRCSPALAILDGREGRWKVGGDNPTA